MLFLILLYTKKNLTNCLNKFTVKRGLLKQKVLKFYQETYITFNDSSEAIDSN